jgi:hypothetical protein
MLVLSDAGLQSSLHELLTLQEDDPRRHYEGDALIRRLFKLGLLSRDEKKLDYVLGMTTNQLWREDCKPASLRTSMPNHSITQEF